VAITVTTPQGPLTLLAVADPGVRYAGKRGLGVRLAELTSSQIELLRSVGAAVPEVSAPTKEAPPNRGRELYRRALEKIETAKYDSALLDLKVARDLEPADPLIQAAMMRAEELAGVEKARNLFRRSESLTEKEPSEALRLVEDAIRLDPTRAMYHREAARLCLQIGGSVEHAEERLGAAIHLAPSDPAPRLLLAQMLERAGRPQEAFWACEAALGLFPGDKELLKLATRLRRKAAVAPAI
jgi:tetratricopeptide (TPR) repeat protein